MTRTTPLRLIILHFGQRLLTDDDTFIFLHSWFTPSQQSKQSGRLRGAFLISPALSLSSSGFSRLKLTMRWQTKLIVSHLFRELSTDSHVNPGFIKMPLELPGASPAELAPPVGRHQPRPIGRVRHSSQVRAPSAPGKRPFAYESSPGCHRSDLLFAPA